MPRHLPLEALGRQMNVVGWPSETPWVKNVGLLFFNEAPERFFPYAQIDVVWFPEGAEGDRFDEKISKGRWRACCVRRWPTSSATTCTRR